MKNFNIKKTNKIIAVALAAVMIMTMLFACGGNGGDTTPPNNGGNNPPINGNDSLFAGMMPDRVFVLDHSALDIIYTLGFGDNVVGVLGGRSAADATHLNHFLESPAVRVLDMHLGGMGSAVTTAGGGVFANAPNTRITGSTIFGNRAGDIVYDVARAHANLDGGNNQFGVVVSNSEETPFVLHNTSELNAEDAQLLARLQALTVPTRTPSGTGVTTWAELQSAVAGAESGDVIRIGANLTMNSVLVIEQDITIYGNGFTLTKSAPVVGAPIIIRGGYDVNVTIQNIVFDGANYDNAKPYTGTTYDGGIIRNTANLTISNAIFKNGFSHMITGGVGLGGAIFSSTPADSEPVTLAIFDSFFYNNFAGRQGGAIRSTGVLFVENTYFINNTETRSGGGAISASGATTIIDSTFFGNVAAHGAVTENSFGGAIHFTGNNPMIIEDSIVVGNTAGAIPTAEGGAATNIEVFLTIDADLIIIGAGLAHLYETVFSQIAPTLLINAPIDHEDGVFAGAFEAARMIAPLWNAQEEAEALITNLTERFDAISAVVAQRSGVAVTLTSGAAATAPDGGFLIAGETAFESGLLGIMGFTHFDRNAIPAHFADAVEMSNYAADLIATAYLAGEEIEVTLQDVMEMFIAWVDNNPNIDYVIVFSNEFATIDEATAGGRVINAQGVTTFTPDFSAISAMQSYADGYFAFFSNTSNTNGLGRLAGQLTALETIFG
ncbi:MAG: ABC transporter substrate-binding protein [Oscillospiraceae bacterium]|nr:ABC transporter substrate-binding protein [Oscillospiraceae bacterium]